MDPVALAQALIRCNSVTPADGGAQKLLSTTLEQLGFHVWDLPFGTTPNLFARRGDAGPHLCFAGHTDVVPAGQAGWTTDPFGGDVIDGTLFGRGACDMKGAIAAFVAAIPDTAGPGSISLLITGDEEGPAQDGTVRVLDWMAANGHIPDFCLVGEPTNPEHLGEVVKIGRRGSINARITIHGTQGHVAYPHKADNPLHRLVRILDALTAVPLDAGSTWFEPSTLQLTSIDVGNTATNVIPAAATAMLNIRFNDHHTGLDLEAWLRATIARYADRFDLSVTISGESFLTKPGPMVDALQAAIAQACGRTPRLDTGGGTSDARFITRYCPVAEFGLVGATMHQVNECVPVAELHALTDAYRAVLAALSVRSALLGAVQLAIGRRAGIARFGDTPAAFMSSLAPLIAFPLVGAAALLLGGDMLQAITTVLLTLVAQLAPAVMSHALAVRWGREAEWLRYATAFNWCQWAIPAAAMMLLIVLQLATAGGLGDEVAGDLLVVGLAAYALWLHWVLARAGLALGRGRALLLVLAVNISTVVLVLGPRWVAVLLRS